MLRRLIYRAGFRPEKGSLFYSPSLDYIYKVADAMKRQKLWEKLNEKRCPTCNGYKNIPGTDRWVKTRHTVGMVCQTCGTDYSEGES